MQRSDYLNPVSMKEQCKKAVHRMEQDNKALDVVSKSINEFSQADELESLSFHALKRQLQDYMIIIVGLKAASLSDMQDFKKLEDSVGEEVLDGENIFLQMENALSTKQSYETNEAMLRDKMKSSCDPFTYLYYSRKAEKYSELAGMGQSLYEKWVKKAESFDAIASGTAGLFAGGEEIVSAVKTGLTQIAGAFQDGSYRHKKDTSWRNQILNASLRLTMSFEEYGGRQEGPGAAWMLGQNGDREYIRELIHSYEEYEDYTDEEITRFLEKLNSEGCGYVAFANIIVDEYRGKEEEFEKVFGFPLFSKTASGKEDVNYDRLVLDLYCASDNHNEEGNAWDRYDIYDTEEDFSQTRGFGTTREDRIYRFERYMKAYGIKGEIKNIECSVQNVYQRCKKEAAKGNRVIISTHPVILEDARGRMVQMDGGHAMTVTGLTDDGRITVSSWGKKYYIDPENPDFREICPEGECVADAYIQIQSVSFD
ncbi:hypothetical protein AALC75_14250 [Lachnospiraceae bacterium 48-42]